MSLRELTMENMSRIFAVAASDRDTTVWGASIPSLCRFMGVKI